MAVRGINKVILVGRLGKDPEVRYIPNGGAVANLQVATSESWRDKQTGEMREQTISRSERLTVTTAPSCAGHHRRDEDERIFQNTSGAA